MSVIIWHNPKCSKSRQALALLEERGESPTVRKYLDDPPSASEIEAVVNKLGLPDPTGLVRQKEALYKELGVENMTGPKLLKVLADNPRLIERPIVITNKGARIGRPTEAVLEIL